MSDKPKTLEDLVPPLELCKAAAEVVGNGTALVYKQVPYKYKDGIVVKKKWIICKRVFDNAVFQIPAPTLAELLEMLPGGTTLKKDDVSVWISWKLTTVRDQNPATAALRLLMRVKGVGK